MKTTLLLLVTLAALLCGCQQRLSPTPPPLPQYEMLTLDWYDDARVAPAHCLVIGSPNPAGTANKLVATDAPSLEAAANILGGYGWHLVAVERDGLSVKWRLERQKRADDKTFTLFEMSAADFNAKFNK